MSATKSRFSISLKFFLFTAVIIVLLVSVTLWFSSRKARALANETIRQGLNETISVFETFQKDRYTKLKMTNNLIAQNPYIQAYVANADSVSILDLARQTEAELKSDFIIVVDPDGTILARTDKPASSGRDLNDTPLIQEALEGEEVAGLWLENQNLYNAVALPVITADEITAAFAVGYSINDTVAGEIKNLTHSEVAFLLMPPSGEPVLLASTLPVQREALMSQFSAHRESKDPVKFRLGSEEYIGVFKPLVNPDGKRLATFVAFRSLDRELLGFRQFQANILYVALGTMVFAFLLSFMGARRITGPLRRLTEAINEVKEGNYEVPIEAHSRDEVGILADSFRKLLHELKEKAQLVQYLSKQATLLDGVPTLMQPGVTAPTGAPVAVQTSQTLAHIVPGTVIGNRYEVQSVLGAGGMGVVLKAKDRQLDEVVALKMLKGEVFSQDPAALERFKQELKLARRITHRHVLRTYDYMEVDNYYVISMEYIKGITLKQLIRQRGMLPLKIGLQIAKQISSALDAAHEKGVVHRDIKPQNILLESTGDVKIMDFGIARLTDMKGITTTGMVMGTPDYMSPEQAQGLTIDHRTDIYSTGVVLYEMFCGRLPFMADSALAVLNQHIRENPPRPTDVNPKIPLQLEKILLKTLAKNPDVRYQNISELYNDLDAVSASMTAPINATA